MSKTGISYIRAHMVSIMYDEVYHPLEDITEPSIAKYLYSMLHNSLWWNTITTQEYIVTADIKRKVIHSNETEQ